MLPSRCLLDPLHGPLLLVVRAPLCVRVAVECTKSPLYIVFVPQTTLVVPP